MEFIPQRYVWRNAKQFAKAMGWHLASWKREHFSLDDLRHRRARCTYKDMHQLRASGNSSLRAMEFFRGAVDDLLLPAGIVSHPLGADFDPHRLWAESENLRATLLPCSWLSPACIGVLYTPPEMELDEDW